MKRLLAAVLPVGIVAASWCVAAPTAQAMSHGTPAQAGEAPWFAELTLTAAAAQQLSEPARTVFANPVNRGLCGGVLIAPTKVLTAAHCLASPGEKPMDTAGLEIRIGDGALAGSKAETIPVGSVTVDPGYALVPSPRNPGSVESSGAHHDLALLTLTKPATAHPIQLAPSAPAPGTSATLYGHGLTPQQRPGVFKSDQLLAGRARVLAAAELAPPVADALKFPGTIAIGGTDVSAGGGDSGGPIVVGTGTSAQLAGIFSFGTEYVTGEINFTPGFNAGAEPATIRAFLARIR
jgi:secreted trypsin-like serine protease